MVDALVDRLRGIYRIPITDGLGAVGSGEEPDNPNEFVRKFETAPIQHEAADRIEALERENERLRRLDAASESTFTAWRSRAVTAERQLAEARAERDTLAMHLEAKAILAKRDNARLREALTDVLDRFVDAFPAAATYGPVIRARAAVENGGGNV